MEVNAEKIGQYTLFLIPYTITTINNMYYYGIIVIICPGYSLETCIETHSSRCDEFYMRVRKICLCMKGLELHFIRYSCWERLYYEEYLLMYPRYYSFLTLFKNRGHTEQKVVTEIFLIM